MSRKKKEIKSVNEVIKSPSNFSINDCVEIQTEAYYRALKRIENEKSSNNHKIGNAHLSKKELASLFINVLFRPKHIQKIGKTHIADSLLSLFMSLFFDLIGYSIRVIAAILIFYNIVVLITSGINTSSLIFIVFGIFLVMFGGFFNASSKEIENEKNYEKLYAYSASIMAVFAVIISAITLIIQFTH